MRLGVKERTNLATASPLQWAGNSNANEGDQQPQDEQSSHDAERSAEPGQSRQGDKETGNQGENQPRDGESSPDGKQQRGKGQPKSNDEQTGAGAAGGESSQRGSQPAGTRQPASRMPGRPVPMAITRQNLPTVSSATAANSNNPRPRKPRFRPRATTMPKRSIASSSTWSARAS